MLEEAEKEKYEKSAAGKNIMDFSYNIGRNIFNISVRIFHLGGRHTVCQGSFNSHLGD